MEAYYSYNQTAFCMGANWNKKAFVLIRWQLSRRWPLQTVLFVFVLVYNYLWLQDLAEILSEKFDLIDIDSVLLSQTHMLSQYHILSFCNEISLINGVLSSVIFFFSCWVYLINVCTFSLLFFFNYYIFKGVGS